MDRISKFLSDYGNYIVWIPTLILLICVFINFLSGLRRGLRKNLILMSISLVSFITAYLIFLLFLRGKAFESLVLDTYHSLRGESLNKTLNVSESYDRFKTIISAFIESKISDSGKKEVYETFSPYVEMLATSILGLIYMIVTIILWRIIYFFIGYLLIYNIFFSERRYRKKINKRYDDAVQKAENDKANAQKEAQMASIMQAIEAENNRDVSDNVEHVETPQAPSNTEVEDTNLPAKYKRRRLLGGCVGLVRGLIFGLLFASVFATVFYLSTGLKTDIYDDNGDTISVSYNGKNYDLTEIYKFVYEYDNTGVNSVLNKSKISGTPIYVSVSNLFCNGKIVVSEDGINTKVYPIEELGHLMEIMHSGVELLNKYNVSIDKGNILETFNNLIDNNENFTDDLYNFITSFGSTKLHRALGKTLTKNFADIVTNLGYNNKYFDVVFKGDNAINIDDLLTKSDIKQFIKIASSAIDVYQDYKDNKDVKDLVINNCNDVKLLSDELVKLSIFNSDNNGNLNACVSDLLEVALESNKTLNGVSFDGISWFGNGGNGEIKNFITSLTKFLNSNVLLYEENQIYFDFENVNAIFESTTDETSVMDDIKTSTAIRRIGSQILNKVNINGSGIYIPDSCKDSDGYISSTEFEGFFNSLKNIVLAIDLSTTEKTTAKEIANVVLPEVIDAIETNNDIATYAVSSKLLSSIASRAIYKTISETSYTIPSELVLDDDNIDSNIDNWLGTDGELYSLLVGASKLGLSSIIEDGASVDLAINTVLKVTDDDIDTLMNSKIINSIVTDTIEEQSIDGITLIVLDDAKDNNYIKSTEIKGIMHFVKALTGYDTMTDEEKEAIDISALDISVSSVLSSASIRNSIYESTILEATIAYKLYSSESGMLIIPNELKLPNTDSENFDNWLGTTGELYYLLEGVNKLGIVDQISGDSSDIDVNAILESEYIPDALESKIIWYTVSNKILEEDASNDSLHIPTTVIDSNNNIDKEEIVKVIASINELEKNQAVKDISSFDANVILEYNNISIDTILASYIFWYTLSQEFIGCTGITIPNAAYVDLEATEKYLKKTEIANTLEAIKALDQTDISTIVLDSTKFFALYNDSEKVDTILASYSAYYEISKEMNGHITFPEITITNISEQNYITKAEIKNVLNAAHVLGITCVDDLDVNISTVLSLNSNQIDIIISSILVWNEITKNMINSDELVVTYDAMTTISEASNSIDLISSLEIKYICLVLNTLGITDFTNVDISPKAISEANLTQTCADSVILRCSISNKIFYINNISSMPAAMETHSIYGYPSTTPAQYYFTSEEVSNIIEGLAVLNISSYDSGITFDLEEFAANENKDIILQAYTLWLYVSNLILDDPYASLAIEESDKVNMDICRHSSVSYDAESNPYYTLITTSADVVTKEKLKTTV